MRGQSVTYQFREEQMSGEFVGNIERDMLLQGVITQDDVGQDSGSTSTGQSAALTSSDCGNAIINITDMNDNAPLFPQPYVSLNVPESVPPYHVLHTSGAVDKDTGDNNSLDREAREFYQLQVRVVDGGFPQRSGSLTVNITVTDVNDNDPVFDQPLYNVTVKENVQTNLPILQVSAKDKDKGSNGQLTYMFRLARARQNGLVICSMNDPFFSLHKFNDHVNDMYKVLLKNPLDHETAPTHRCDHHVPDNGDPVLVNSTGFTVHVKDVNDMAPQFSQPTYTGSVIENTPGVSAVDYDTGLGGHVEFYLEDTPDVNNRFSIDPDTGVIQVLTPLNREDKGQHTFLVWAHDKGVPRLSSSATVIITVQDQNDEKPYFTRSLFDCYILEKQPVGTRVGNVRCFDRETRHEYKFQVKVEDPQVPQFFDRANGHRAGSLRLARTILPADVKKYTLEIEVQDGGNPPISENAELHVAVSAGNGTLPVQGSQMDQNILIVIILVCVTLVLAIAVVVTICLIRRIDRERQQRRAASKAEEEKMFHLKNPDAFINMSAENSTGSDASSNSSGKNKKKEACQLMEMLKRNGEDAMSESSGETGTSDSGRGGSEDDSHSNRGSALDPDGSAMYPQVYGRGGMSSPSVPRQFR
nr:hypothetical protein BaRGS_004599 [Batillaria attramentaria]